jgi:nucleotide-binding universal stress UspA family protein
MIEIRRILCPTDFSECSRTAVKHAMALARAYRSEIIALHVAPVLPRWDLPAIGESELAPAPVQRMLEQFLSPALELGLATSVRVAEGGAAHEILRQARESDVDLVVMGTHGRGGFRRLVVGSVSEDVLRKAPCPVLTVREATALERPSRPPFRKVLCPIDFSPAASRAVRHALALAEAPGVDLTLLHVIQPQIDSEIQKRVHFDTDEYWRQLEGEALMRMDALVLPHVRGHCRVRLLTRIGSAGEEIVRFAARDGADLVVMGVHGRSALRLTVFGAVAQEVVRAAACPVLTIGRRAVGRVRDTEAAVSEAVSV